MKKVFRYPFLIIGWIMLSASVACTSSASGIAEVEKSFSGTPPKTAYPWVWWHWMNGNVTKDPLLF